MPFPGRGCRTVARVKRPLSIVAVALLVSACGSGRTELPVAGVSVDGSRIAVYDWCHDDPTLEVDEDPAAVEIRFSVREESGGDCFSCTEVTLEEPLGDRAVIDASTGREVPTTGDCFNPP